jgi:hypothetical protein
VEWDTVSAAKLKATGAVAKAASFADAIEKQANTLAQSGWMHEATDLRKWASELRIRTTITESGREHPRQSRK